jgi:hypothetical protein
MGCVRRSRHVRDRGGGVDREVRGCPDGQRGSGLGCPGMSGTEVMGRAGMSADVWDRGCGLDRKVRGCRNGEDGWVQVDHETPAGNGPAATTRRVSLAIACPHGSTRRPAATCSAERRDYSSRAGASIDTSRSRPTRAQPGKLQRIDHAETPRNTPRAAPRGRQPDRRVRLGRSSEAGSTTASSSTGAGTATTGAGATTVGDATTTDATSADATTDDAHSSGGASEDT